MSRREKRKARFRDPPAEMSFDEVRAVLEAEGWMLKPGSRTSSSHVAFEKPGELPITLAITGGQDVKRTYLVKIRDRLGMDED